ncbi:fumarylacetoacetate hydrolase family protein [Pseudalkalibacillus salsuginis]|uniref:fumarylacetoacetate hydrolase family protein n=1 Tax=Pseudalkalibacillus salsuginis TaxID=2910972 RepID=UPI001F46C16E|nr:fumarylacetoacetate hydrolase family protein [Pseudalkalibacillus salsuginis]MCF6411331.1 fumarylacetoacetate hydrolase family protein [Pseudalkalibacillus salsuginis]
MRIIRFINDQNTPTLGAITDEDKVYRLPYRCFLELVEESKKRQKSPLELIHPILSKGEPLNRNVTELSLLVPIEAKEVWASGVTYMRSKEARNYEATGGKLDADTFYDKVYDADRPEIFFKSTVDRTIGTDEPVYLRSDSDWQIPEPELGLVLDSDGSILAYTVGNDMSCRDIEGENPLYLPQAKIWKNSCAIGPSIRLAETVKDPYEFEINCRIYRNENLVFEDSAKVSQLKRKLKELTDYLMKDNVVFPGTVLLTGTCIVPPNEFTLNDGDRVEIEIPGIGLLRNPVKSQVESQTIVS